jgi:hypothetical protein
MTERGSEAAQRCTAIVVRSKLLARAESGTYDRNRGDYNNSDWLSARIGFASDGNMRDWLRGFARRAKLGARMALE